MQFFLMRISSVSQNLLREALRAGTQFEPTFRIKKMLKLNAVVQHHAFESLEQVPVTALASMSSTGEAVARPATVMAARMFVRRMFNDQGSCSSVSNSKLMMGYSVESISEEFSAFKYIKWRLKIWTLS